MSNGTVIDGVDITQLRTWKKVEPHIKRRFRSTKRRYITVLENSRLFSEIVAKTKSQCHGSGFMHGLRLQSCLRTTLSEMDVRVGARDRPKPRNKSGKTFAEMSAKWEKAYRVGVFGCPTNVPT